jgi:hypothetical protein
MRENDTLLEGICQFSNCQEYHNNNPGAYFSSDCIFMLWPASTII